MSEELTTSNNSAVQSLTPVDVAVPTTKVLAIGRLTSRGTPDAVAAILPSEVRGTARLYLAGKIDQWFFQTSGSGVVFVMNLADPDEAQALLEQLPLGQAGMMEFDFIKLGPLQPLGLLLNMPAS